MRKSPGAHAHNCSRSNQHMITEPSSSNYKQDYYYTNLKTKQSSIQLNNRTRSKSPLSPSKTILGSIKKGIRTNDVSKIIQKKSGFLPNIGSGSNTNIFHVDIYKENHVILTQLQAEFNKLQSEN